MTKGIRPQHLRDFIDQCYSCVFNVSTARIDDAFREHRYIYYGDVFSFPSRGLTLHIRLYVYTPMCPSAAYIVC